jgi:alkaline phosphatase
MNQATGVGWTSNAHTGVDVPVFAFGVGAEKFRGSKRNSDIGKLMIDLIQVDPERGYQVFRDRIGLRDPSDGG